MSDLDHARQMLAIACRDTAGGPKWGQKSLSLLCQAMLYIFHFPAVFVYS